MWFFYSRMLLERSMAKNNHTVSLLLVVSKVFEKLVNNRFLNHLQKRGFFFRLWFQIKFQVLLTVATDRIGRAFNRSKTTQALALDLPKAFNRVWLFFSTNVSLMEFEVRYMALFRFFSVIDASSGSGWKVFTRISSSS